MCIFLVAKTDATAEQLADADSGKYPVTIVDTDTLDWDTPVTVEKISDVYDFRVMRPPAGSPATLLNCFSSATEALLLKPKHGEVWICRFCLLNFNVDPSSRDWVSCFACSAVFCSSCADKGLKDEHDKTHKRSYLAQVRACGCFCAEACMPRGSAGTNSCKSILEAGRWFTVQVIKNKPKIAGFSKKYLAKIVEFTSRKNCDGSVVVPQLLSSTSAVLVVVLGAAEDEEAHVTLCVLVTPPFKLKKQKKIQADGEETKFVAGSTIAEVMVICRLQSNIQIYQKLGRIPPTRSTILAENLLILPTAIDNKKLNMSNYFPYTALQPAVKAINTNTKYTLTKKLVGELLAYGAEVLAERQTEGTAAEDGSQDGSDDEEN
jgi:hypothetical protein